MALVIHILNESGREFGCPKLGYEAHCVNWSRLTIQFLSLAMLKTILKSLKQIGVFSR